MGKVKQLGVNTILMFIGNIGAKFVGFIMLPFYTRWLSQEDYGTTDIIGVYASLLVGLVSCCIAEAVFIFPKNAERDKQEAYFTSALGFSGLMLTLAALVFCLLRIAFDVMGVQNSFSEYTWWIYTLMVVQFIQTFLQQFCRSIDKIFLYSVTGVLLAVFTAAFSFFLIPNYGVWGYLVAMTLSSLLSSACLFFVGKLHAYIKIRSFRKDLLKEMLAYCIPLMPNAIMWWLINSLNRPFLENSVGLAGIGILAVSQKIPTLVSVVFGVFGSAWQISVLDEYGKKDFNQFFGFVFNTFSTGIALLVVVVSFFAKDLMSLIVGPDFIEGYVYVPVLCTTIYFLSLNTIVSPVFSAVRKSKYFFSTSVYGAIVTIICNIALIPFWGIWGAVTGICLAQAVMAVVRLYYASPFVKPGGKTMQLATAILVMTFVLSCTLIERGVALTLLFISVMIVISILYYIKNKGLLCSYLRKIS